MKAEVKLLKVLQPGEEFQLLVRIEATARARIPDRPRQVQFLKPGKPADLFQVLRLNQRPNQVNADDANLAGGQLRDISDGFAFLALRFEHDATTLSDYPLGNLPLRRLSRRVCRNAEQQRRAQERFQNCLPHHHCFRPCPYKIAPGRAPVCRPRSRTILPLTMTDSTPVAYWCGFSKVALSMIVSGLKTVTSAHCPGRNNPRS